MPRKLKPALAADTSAPPTGPGYWHEMKFDGYRVTAFVEGGRARLMSRNGHDYTDEFGKTLADAFAALPAATAILDGEAVVEVNGVADFQALEEAISQNRHRLIRAYVFDLVYLDGYDLQRAPLEARWEALVLLAGGAAPVIRVSDHFDELQAAELKSWVCSRGGEGIVSKRRTSTYQQGKRIWLKSKCEQTIDCVVGGYVPSRRGAPGFDALLLGAYTPDGRLRYAGSVTAGWSAEAAAALRTRLDRKISLANPFSGKAFAKSSLPRFVKPTEVVEITCSGVTSDGRIRHGSFKRSRRDKGPADIRPRT